MQGCRMRWKKYISLLSEEADAPVCDSVHYHAGRVHSGTNNMRNHPNARVGTRYPVPQISGDALCIFPSI